MLVKILSITFEMIFNHTNHENYSGSMLGEEANLEDYRGPAHWPSS